MSRALIALGVLLAGCGRRRGWPMSPVRCKTCRGHGVFEVRGLGVLWICLGHVGVHRLPLERFLGPEREASHG